MVIRIILSVRSESCIVYERVLIMKSLGVRITELLNKRGMTQKELADLAGVTEATISRYVSGDRMPKSQILSNMATALKTTSDYLLGNEEEGDLESDFTQIERLIARNANKMTHKQRKELIDMLFQD